MPIKALIFDFGGVLTRKVYLEDFCDYYSQIHRLDAEEMKKLIGALWTKARVSAIDSNLFWAKLADFSGIEISKFKKDFKDFWGFRNDTYNFILRRLKGKYKLGLLSNHIKTWLEPIIEEKRLAQLFDTIVTSYESKIAKPDIRIFKEVLAKLDIAPQDCIYIDDMPKNILPAQKLGMKTILFEDLNQLKKELKRLGVEF